MLKIKQFAFNDFGVNTFLVFDSDSRDAMVVDPGMIETHERVIFDRYIEQEGLKITQIVNTHLHLDHCFGDNYVRDKYGVKVAAHVDDALLGAVLGEQARSFGIALAPDNNKVEIDVPLADGDTIRVGQYSFTVLHVPGHSPGGMALYCADAKIAIVGDSIFRASIGRTDLEGGNYDQLIDSLRKKILTMPDDVQLLPGHGGPTTVGYERAHNPFLAR